MGALSDGDNISGSGTTTVTLSNLKTPDDNGAEFFLRADYVPAQRTTGNAVNEPLDSDTATVTVDPLIRITTQPTNRQSLIDTDTNFSVVSNLSDSTNENPLTFQWSLDGTDIDDGTITTDFPLTNVDVTYTSDSTINIPSDATNVEITVASGKGGDGGDDAGAVGGQGGNGRAGKFTLSDGARTLFMRVGNQGQMTEQVEILNLADLVVIVLLRLVALVEVQEHRVGLVVEAAVAALVVYLTLRKWRISNHRWWRWRRWWCLT